MATNGRRVGVSSAKWAPWLIACFTIWEEVNGGVQVIASVDWLCVEKGKSYETLSSLSWKTFSHFAFVQNSQLSFQGLQAWFSGTDAVLGPGVTPAFFLMLLRKSSSLLFFLIKSDNIWCARERAALMWRALLLVLFWPFRLFAPSASLSFKLHLKQPRTPWSKVLNHLCENHLSRSVNKWWNTFISCLSSS